MVLRGGSLQLMYSPFTCRAASLVTSHPYLCREEGCHRAISVPWWFSREAPPRRNLSHQCLADHQGERRVFAGIPLIR